MRPNLSSLLAASAFAGAMITPGALAQDDPTPSPDATVIVLDQVLLGPVNSQFDIVIDDTATGATAISTATGNAADGSVITGDVDVDVTQDQQFAVTATSSINGGTVFGDPASTVTTAYGNSATSSTSGTDSTTFHTATQTSSAAVSASSDITLTGADTVTAATTAAANISTYSTDPGTNRGFSTQTATADVTATTDADLCCNNTSVELNTTATGNSVSSYGATTTSFNGAVQTTGAAATISGATNAVIGNGTNVSAATRVAGNSATVHNEFGFATLGRDGSDLFQGNGADVTGTTTVTLTDFSGDTSATAYGVGNSALIANVGSDTQMFSNQENFGLVSTNAYLEGGSLDGSNAFVNATSIGNAATATLCYTCGSGIVSGRTNQTNSAATSAVATARITSGGSAYGAATAVGNSSTFRTTDAGN